VQTKYILGGVGEASAKFAVLMKLPFASAATHVAKFQESMGVADNQAVAFMDTLQRLKFASGVEIGDLAYSFKYMGSSLKSLNIQGLEDAKKISAVIGVMAANSIEGSTAGTNFAAALSKMAMLSHKLDTKKIHELVAPILDPKGIKLNFFTETGQFKGIESMMKELEKLRALNPQEKLIVLEKLFSVEAARPLSLLVDKGLAGYNEMLQRMQQQADMQKKIDEIMSGTKMQWDTLTGTVSNFLAHMGGAIVGGLKLNVVFGRLNDIFGRLDTWVMNHQRLRGRRRRFIFFGSIAG
jgi:TP901 family phage tail tape measure protein